MKCWERRADLGSLRLARRRRGESSCVASDREVVRSNLILDRMAVRARSSAAPSAMLFVGCLLARGSHSTCMDEVSFQCEPSLAFWPSGRLVALSQAVQTYIQLSVT